MHTFVSTDRQRTLKVSTVNLNLIVQNYLHFDDYLQSASKCLSVALDKFRLKEIFRIGLRYINFIKVERIGGEFIVRKYIRPVIAEEIQERADAFLVEITEPRGDKKLTMRSGLLRSEDDADCREYVLDFDCFAEGKQTLGPIDRTLLEFHDVIENRFHEAVSAEYLQYMRTGQW
jgi:uncharacterized protein (TIGR04255 family)